MVSFICYQFAFIIHKKKVEQSLFELNKVDLIKSQLYEYKRQREMQINTHNNNSNNNNNNNNNNNRYNHRETECRSPIKI